MLKILKMWLPIAVGIVGLSLLAFILAQQLNRAGANDPQIQMARDAAKALENGAVPASVVPRSLFDVGASLNSFISVYDESGLSLESSGVIDGRPPLPPAGVFAYTREHKENRVTWQPNASLRLATVVVHYQGARPGFVLVGRSLEEVEDRAAMLLQLAILGCFSVLVVSFGAVWILNKS